MNHTERKNVEFKSEEALSPLKLPDIDLLDSQEEKERFKQYFKEIIDEEGSEKFKDEENYNKAKVEYEQLFGIFHAEETDSEILLKSYEDEVRSLGFYKLEDLEKAIENDDFDLSKYDMFTIGKLIRNMEKNELTPKLSSYGVKDMEDFYRKVSSSEINISNYSEDEIDSFIDKIIGESGAKNGKQKRST